MKHINKIFMRKTNIINLIELEEFKTLISFTGSDCSSSTSILIEQCK